MRLLRRRQRKNAFNDRALDSFVVAGVVLLVIGLVVAGYRLKDGGYTVKYVSASPLSAAPASDGSGSSGAGTTQQSPIDVRVEAALVPITVPPRGGDSLSASSVLRDVTSPTTGSIPGSTIATLPGSTTTTVPPSTTTTEPPTTTTTEPPTTTTTEPPTTTTTESPEPPPPPPPDDDHQGPGRDGRGFGFGFGDRNPDARLG